MSTPAGWYPVENYERYWDGSAWTEQTRGDGSPAEAKAPGRFKGLASSAAANLTGKGEFPANAVWSEVGKPMSGIGAGRYWMDATYLYFEKGTLRTDSQQVPIAQVMDVDVAQTMTQKARSVFNVTVRINRGDRVEVVVMEDIPSGREAQRRINDAAHRARAAMTAVQNTSTVQYVGGVPIAPTPTTAVAEPVADPIAQLEKLAALRDGGILTEEEFAAKKAEILSRM